ncbi:hypothetical protein GQ42DRAFT_105417, partial [Ramicandelaber brevisporus]
MARMHSAIVTDEMAGNLYMAGHGQRGQLGDSIGTALNFRRVQSLRDVRIVAVAIGRSHSVALDEESRVFVWGSNEHGQLG